MRIVIFYMLISTSAFSQFRLKGDTLIYANGTGDTVRINQTNQAIKQMLNDNVVAYRALGSGVIAQTVDFPLQYCNVASGLTDGQIRFIAVQLPVSTTLTGIKVYVRTLGVYTGDNNNIVGLYSYAAGTGTLTLVASSSNSSTLWTSAANAVQNIPFSSTYAAQPGTYYVALLYNRSAQTTAPAFASGTALNNAAMAGTAFGFSNSAKLYGTVNTQTSLPATIAMTSITASTAPLWVSIY